MTEITDLFFPFVDLKKLYDYIKMMRDTNAGEVKLTISHETDGAAFDVIVILKIEDKKKKYKL